MNPHPRAVLIVERQNGYQWRVVARKTTERGFSSEFNDVERDIGELKKARKRLVFHRQQQNKGVAHG